ncbi:DUF1294 domain-containing protein [Paraburkholderia aspalathi]|nr:DUF1294 domain-containing protein [Paraburkholderia aspalathi]MBK3780066.1 DUF1294 domain-containing protein [Paraburkholderia aspalathi]
MRTGYRPDYRQRSYSTNNWGVGYVLIECIFCFVWLFGPVPIPVKALVFVLNVAAFWLYRFDKQQAVAGERRVPEKWLFAITLFGGMMGADFARRIFRHKTRKLSFAICMFFALTLQMLAMSMIFSLGDHPPQVNQQQATSPAAPAPVARHHKHTHYSNAKAASSVE